MHTHNIQSPDTLDPHMLEASYSLTVAICIAQTQLSEAQRIINIHEREGETVAVNTHERAQRLRQRIQALDASRSFIEAELCGVIPS